MKTKVLISFEAGHTPGMAEAVLRGAGCGPDVAKVSSSVLIASGIHNKTYPEESAEIKLFEGDERIAKVLALLNEYGEQADVTTYRIYSEKDRQDARLLWMSPGETHGIARASELGTKYDMTNACPHCGTGAKQTWFLRVRRNDLRLIRNHRAIMSYDHNILVDEYIRQKLIDAGITGISFAEVHAREDRTEWKAIERNQLLIEHTMPPIRAEFPADDEKALCTVCRRGGRWTMPDEPYCEEDLVGMKDFNLTWEWFDAYYFNGNPRESMFSHPYVLVTPKVMNIFREMKVKSFKWTPVGLEK